MGNVAVVGAFTAAGRTCRAFVGHYLDADNLALLRSGHISAVLHHDLVEDMRNGCLAIMRAHGLLPKLAASTVSNIQIVTPFNLPGIVST